MDIEKKCLDIEWCVNPMHLKVVKKKTLLFKAYKFDMTVRVYSRRVHNNILVP